MTALSLPKTSPLLALTFPTSTQNILLVTLDRPEKLNAIPGHGHQEMARVWEWMDQQPEIRCGIVTGKGRAFCAGADLEEWASNPNRATLPPPGFGGLSRRHGKKPIIAAINGLCIGGGFEMAVNADLIIASASAKFQLPEAQVGVAVLAGALPRLARTVGKQRVTELAITGRTLSAREAREWGLVNEVVERDTDLMPRAVEMAKRVVRCSPDSVIISREGIARGWEGSVVEGDAVTERLWSAVEGTANHEEGLRAWGKRKLPKWEPSKL